jgi:hypothetical protein
MEATMDGGTDDRYRARAKLYEIEIAPAFTPSKPVTFVVSCSLDAVDAADLKYPNWRNPNFFGPGLPEPWKISRRLELPAQSACPWVA